MLARSVMQQSPVSIQYPNAKSVKAFEKIANELMNPGQGEEVKQRGMAAFFSHIITGRKLSSTQAAVEAAASDNSQDKTDKTKAQNSTQNNSQTTTQST